MAHSTPTSQTTTASARAMAKGARPPGQVSDMEAATRPTRLANLLASAQPPPPAPPRIRPKRAPRRAAPALLTASATADASPVAVSVPKAAELLGIGRTLAWQLVRSGRLPARRLPGTERVVVLVTDLQAFATSLEPYKAS